MKQRLLLTIALAVTTLTVAAQSVSVSEARQKAQTFFASQGHELAAEAYRAPRRAAGKPADAAFYVFNAANRAGFVIISGDDRTDEVLAFADHGTFDVNHMPAPVQALLDSYTAQLEQLASADEQEAQQMLRAPRRVPTHANIEPLVQTEWGQGSPTELGHPFNLQCPQLNDNYCVTGCVATALAQILKYHEYPQAPTPAIQSYFSNNTIGTLPQLPSVVFDWANMKNTYSGAETDSTADAVATLMRYCGQAVKMNYGTGGSSASDANIITALRNYFDYDASVRLVQRETSTIAEWDELIYNELAEARPVIYSGQSSGGGHSFICDGYRVRQGTGYYHMNWGWEGNGNGYYKLALANPSTKGTGGGSSVDGYSANQSAIIGIRPEAGTVVEQYSEVWGYEATLSGTDLTIKFQNKGTASYVGRLGVAVVNEDMEVTRVLTNAQINGLPGNASSYTQMTARLNTLSDGHYLLAPVYGDGTNYTFCGLKGLYVDLTIKSRSVESYTIHPEVKIAIVSSTMKGHSLASETQELELRLRNEGDEFNGVLYLFGITPSGAVQQFGLSGLALEEGATETVKFGFRPSTPGTYTLQLYSDNSRRNLLAQRTVEIGTPPSELSQLTLVSNELIRTDSLVFRISVRNDGHEPYLRPIVFRLFQSAQRNGSYPMIEEKTVSIDLQPGETADYECAFTSLPAAYYIVQANRYMMFASNSIAQIARADNSYEPHTLNITDEIGAASLVLPFPSTRPQNVQIYTISYDNAAHTAVAHEYTAETLPARRPFVVVGEPGDYTFVSTLYAELSTTPSAPSTYGIATGVYETTTIPSGTFLLTGVDDDGMPEFQQVERDDMSIGANRAYFTLGAGENLVKSVSSDISQIAAADGKLHDDTAVFDLAGRQLTTVKALRDGRAALRSGIYIIGGSKVYVK